VKTSIVGTTMPILELTLGKGEAIIAESGDVSWLTPGFHMETSTRVGSGSKGGLMSGLRRMIGGGQLFLTQYTADRDGSLLAFSTQLPGEIREVHIGPSDSYMITAGAHMASTPDVEVTVGIQKRLGAGILGGAGVIFQNLSGSGVAWVQVAGETVEYVLERGQSLLIHPSHLAMFHTEMSLEFATMRGISNKFFGDSLFLAELHGPGRVWLQSMTAAKLAAAIQPYLPDLDSSSKS
jgi:uncharacterized protein (TIGR00266 family)